MRSSNTPGQLDLWAASSDPEPVEIQTDNTAEIEALATALSEAREQYYNGQPVMSDAEYDALEDLLRSLAPDHPLLQKVGETPRPDAWRKVRHSAPMGSLEKAQSNADLRDWLASRRSALERHNAENGDSVNGDVLVVMEKLDGISISLRYDNGRLVQALTRGDGDVGEDITANVVRMRGVQPQIAGFSGHLRGEIMVLKDDHRQHFPEYKNPRNTAAGISKRLDGVGCEYLTVILYQVIGERDQRKQDELSFLEAIGCYVPHYQLARSVDEVQAVYDAYRNGRREELSYDIDGLVIQFNDPVAFDILGEQAGRPKGAVAYKFPHDRKVSRLTAVRWQVGPSGRITPVAEFEPVDLAGATIRNASLHTVANIRNLGLERAGSLVVISRRNDVIPYVEAVSLTGEGEVIEPPSACPSCGYSPLVMEGELLVCPNSGVCPAQVTGAVQRWVGKIGLMDWGETLIAELCRRAWVKEPADLYKLPENELAEFTLPSGRRVGETTARKLIAELWAKSELYLADLVGSLGIPLCGRTICELIVSAGYDTLEKLRAATVDEIKAIPGMGETKARAFVNGLVARQEMIDNLLAAGVKVRQVADGLLSGKTFCFTGFRSAELEEAIRYKGGIIKGSATKELDYLVAKDPNGTSGKIKKARENGHTQVIGLDELRALLSA